MKAIIKDFVKGLGYDLKRLDALNDENFAPDIDDEKVIYNKVKPFTMTSMNSVISLIQAVKYIVDNEIEGDLVECGVWRGGSIMAAALTLMNLSESNRHLYLYDTFTGMVEPTELDKQFDGKLASQVWKESTNGAWCEAGLEDVQNNMKSTGYPSENIHYVEGRVEDTIPQNTPAKICLLRLDTDWYDSTKHELEHLYPRLVAGGVLIIDDYGHWSGSKKATDEFFSALKFKPLLQRIDYSRRLVVKPNEC